MRRNDARGSPIRTGRAHAHQGMTASTVFQRTGLGRRPGCFLPGPLELGLEFLQLFTAETGPDLGEPVLFFLLDVMPNVLDQHRGDRRSLTPGALIASQRAWRAGKWQEGAMSQTGRDEAGEDIPPAAISPPGPDEAAGDGRSRRSRLLWEVDRWTGRPLTALGVLTAAAAWVLITLEHASDSELRATRRQHRQVRRAALNQPPRRGDGAPD
jgi:hypothetical protein